MPASKKKTVATRVPPTHAAKTTPAQTSKTRPRPRRTLTVSDRFKRRLQYEREFLAPHWKLSPNEARVPIKEAARLLGFSHWTLRRWVTEGRLKYIRMGQSMHIPQSEIDRILTEGLIF